MKDLATEIKDMINSSPALLSGTRCYGKSWTLERGGILNIYGNIDINDLDFLSDEEGIKTVQFARKFKVSDETLSIINNKILSLNHNTSFGTLFNGYGCFEDLEFLKLLPDLKIFGVSAFKPINIDPIVKYLKLTNLGVGGSNISLKPLRNYESLTSFGFGDKIKDYESISSIPNIEKLNISSQNLKSLAFLISLKKLKRLSFSLGGTVYFQELPQLQNLEELNIWRTRKLEIEHLAPINSIKNLRVLQLKELPRVTTLDFITNSSIKVLVLQEMRGLESYESLASLMSLETLVIKGPLDDTKIRSLEQLKSIKNIQIYPGYLDDIKKSPIKNKFQQIGVEYYR